MTESEKPEGDLEDADGVTTDGKGNPELVMEVLQKGGSGEDESDDVMQKMKTEE